MYLYVLNIYQFFLQKPEKKILPVSLILMALKISIYRHMGFILFHFFSFGLGFGVVISISDPYGTFIPS